MEKADSIIRKINVSKKDKDKILRLKNHILKALETKTVLQVSKGMGLNDAVLSRGVKYLLNYSVDKGKNIKKGLALKRAKKQKELEALKMDEGYIQATKEQIVKLEEELLPLNKRRTELMEEKGRLKKLLQSVTGKKK